MVPSNMMYLHEVDWVHSVGWDPAEHSGVSFQVGVRVSNSTLWIPCTLYEQNIFKAAKFVFFWLKIFLNLVCASPDKAFRGSLKV